MCNLYCMYPYYYSWTFLRDHGDFFYNLKVLFSGKQFVTDEFLAADNNYYSSPQYDFDDGRARRTKSLH